MNRAILYQCLEKAWMCNFLQGSSKTILDRNLWSGLFYSKQTRCPMSWIVFLLYMWFDAKIYRELLTLEKKWALDMEAEVSHYSKTKECSWNKLKKYQLFGSRSEMIHFIATTVYWEVTCTQHCSRNREGSRMNTGAQVLVKRYKSALKVILE